jgi:MoxR-like ATPase
MEPIEPLILAALITAEPLLLIGPHGTAKSYLLCRISEALGLKWRHYNASLLNFDDLVGYPLPDGNGGLHYVQTPSSIWEAEAVFIDEISRCRPDMQNKLFPIIHERRVQGMDLPRLKYRWSAMNVPTADADEDLNAYRGCEPLDQALADRFALAVEMPEWEQFSEAQQQEVILAEDTVVPHDVAERLQATVAAGQALLPGVREQYGPAMSAYVRIVMALLSQAEIVLSPRRGGMLLRNILAVHSARMAADADALVEDSAVLALTYSLPQRAAGVPISSIKLLSAHREAWTTAAMDARDPRRNLVLEPDPLRRALRAAKVESLSPMDYSAIIADALAALPPGARHALAATLFETNTATHLLAAVAEQCASLYAVAVTPQDLHETVAAASPRHLVWQRVVASLARLEHAQPDTELASNLLVGLFAAGELAVATDVDRVLTDWQDTRQRAKEFCK